MQRAVVDTNVLVSALRSRRGASFRLISLLGDSQWQPVISVALILEYEAVGHREAKDWDWKNGWSRALSTCSAGLGHAIRSGLACGRPCETRTTNSYWSLRQRAGRTRSSPTTF